MSDSARKKTLEALKTSLGTDRLDPGARLVPCGLTVQRGPAQPPSMARDRVHEVLPDRPGHGAALGFLIRCLAAAQAVDPRPVLWVSDGRTRSEAGRLYAPGLAEAGLAAARLVCVSVRRERDVLWVLEEALGSGALAGVGGAVTDLALTPSRRLSLAARRTGTPLFLLRPHDATGATAAETRWQITPLPSPPDPFDPQAPGSPAWRIDLVRNRTGAPATWEVICDGDNDDTEDALDLVAGSGHGTLATHAQRGTPRRAGIG